jgi:hypothetical protein
VQKERFLEASTRFVRSVSLFEGDYLLRYDIDADKRSISLIYGGQPLTVDNKKMLKQRAYEFGLENVNLTFEQGLVIGKDKELQEKLIQMQETDQLKLEIARLNAALQRNAKKQDSLRQISYTGFKLLNELKPLFPQITGCLYTEPWLFSDSTGTTPRQISYVLLSSSRQFNLSEREKIESWLKVRLQNERLHVIYE